MAEFEQETDKPTGWRLDRQFVLYSILLIAASYLSGRFGLQVASHDGAVTSIWPPAGIATAAVLIGGLRYVPAVFIGAVLVDVGANGLSWATPGVSLANAVLPAVALVLLRRTEFDRRLGRLFDIAALMALAVVAACALSATVGVLSLALAGLLPWSALLSAWWPWFLGDGLSVMVITPLILILAVDRAPVKRSRRPRLVVLSALMLLQCGIIFGPLFPFGMANFLFSYTLLPVLLWLGLGVGQREASFGNLVVTAFAIYGAVNSYGLFANTQFVDSLYLLHGFLYVTTGTTLLMGAVTLERSEARRESRDAERRLQAVIDHSGAAVFMKDAITGRYILANHAGAHWLGREIDEVVGRTDAELLNPESARITAEANRQVIETGEPLVREESLTHEGGVRHLLTVVFPLFDDHGDIYATGGIATDISDRIKMEDQLRDSERRYRTLFEAAFDAILILRHELIRDCNSRAVDLLGRSRDDLIGSSIQDVLPDPTELERILRTQSLADGVSDIVTLESLVTPVDGLPLDVEILHQRVELNGEAFDSVVLRDISKRKRAERLLRHQAHYDPLTDLPNRLFAFERMEQAMGFAADLGEKVAVMFLDLDLFKNINDSLGHKVGDELLIKVGHRLVQALTPEDMVARLGGDEFLVMKAHCNDAEDVVPLARDLLDRINQPYQVGTHELFLGASIGITLYPDDGEDPETLLRNADSALYEAKSRGRSTYAFFTRDLDERGRRRLLIESHLRHAIRLGELSLVYQPQFDIESGRIVAVEALMRWSNDVIGVVSPDEFIGIAEESGYIGSLGEWAIDRACAEAASWLKRMPNPPRLGINVSPGQLRDDRVLRALEASRERHGVEPSWIELEITERVLLDDSRDVHRRIEALLDLGVSLSLDDFGTGYSSISYLRRLPFSALKLDRSFVAGVDTSEVAARLCQSILSLARILDIPVVGEGVESEGQLEFLRRHGAATYQGYLGSRPVTAEQIAALLEAGATV